LKPTTGYCYLLSEVLYHYAFQDSESYVINLGPHGTHWFLKNHNAIIDWTADQYNFKVDYSTARRATFFKGTHQTRRGFISQKGFLLAKYLKVVQ
jgi:hypothetical protein